MAELKEHMDSWKDLQHYEELDENSNQPKGFLSKAEGKDIFETLFVYFHTLDQEKSAFAA
jgi:hypothetical protein